MANWSDKRCMSSLKGKSERCKKKQLRGDDFCKTHSIERIYNKEFLNEKTKIHCGTDALDKYLNIVTDEFSHCIENQVKYLDEQFIHGLIGLNESWVEIPFIYWCKFGDTWWDIRTLMRTLAMQLNQSELEKPFPIFPENPFTRKKFSVSELYCLRDHILSLKQSVDPTELNVHISLTKFLSLPEKFLNSIRNDKSQYNVSTKIIRKFSTTMRYKMINYKDSQGRYCGYWVKKTVQLSPFEKCYNEIITATVMFNNIYVLFDTPMYRKIINTINRLTPEEYII